MEPSLNARAEICQQKRQASCLPYVRRCMARLCPAIVEKERHGLHSQHFGDRKYPHREFHSRDHDF